MKSRCLIFLIPGLLATLAHADGLDSFKHFVRDVHSARAAFSQQVLDQAGHVKQQASGTLAFSRPGKFRWVYAKPYAQLIVGDGSKLWLYDKDLDQVTVRKLGDALGSSPAALLAGSADIDKYFDLKDLGEQHGVEWMVARPKDNQTTFNSVRMGFVGNVPVSMELKDAFGQTTVLTFSKLERNPKLDPADFRFTPPQGADIISD
jgi:outer membrane lipoprotein carrier protein